MSQNEEVKMIIGMSTACFFGREVVEDAVLKIAGIGAENIEVFLNTYSEYSPDYLKKLRQIIEDKGLNVNSLHPQGVQYEPQLFSPYARAQEDAFDVYERVLEACNILGAKLTVMHGGLNFKPARKIEINFERVGKIVARAAECAAQHGVKLAYENVHWCWFKYPGFAKEILQAAQHPNLYFNLDIKQAAQTGGNPLDFLDAMGERVINVHICDYVHMGTYIEPRMPFKGEMDFGSLRSRLKDFDGGLVLEVYGDSYREESELKESFEQMKAYFSPKEDCSQ